MAAQAVVFDLDDTLYSERSYAFSGFAAVAAAFAERLGNVSELEAVMRRLFDTEHRARVFNEVLRRAGAGEDAQLVAEMVRTFRTHRPTIRLYADAEEALNYWRVGARTGILSDGPAVMQRAKVEALGLADRVDAIILTDEWGAGYAKPAVRGFEMMAERLGVGHKGCAYVGDNPAKDFVGPRALGWRTVRVLRADGVYRDHPVAAGGDPDATVASLADLPRVLS